MTDHAVLGPGDRAPLIEETLGQPLGKLLEVRDLRAGGGSDGAPSLRGLALDVGWGETTALVGGAGAGKTLLTRALVGLAPVTAGSIRLDGTEIAGARGDARRAVLRRLQLVTPPSPLAMDPRWPVRDIVAEPLRHLGVGGRGVRRGVREILGECGFAPEREGLLPSDLTAVDLQRVALARALSMHPDLVVLDDPLRGLDLTGQTQLVDLLRQLQIRMGVAFLLLTRDLAFARVMADELAIAHRGRIAEQGTATAILARPRHPLTRALIDALLPVTPGPWVDRERFQLKGDGDSRSVGETGCSLRARCPLATQRCGERTPPMRDLAPQQGVACHHADQVPERAADEE